MGASASPLGMEEGKAVVEGGKWAKRWYSRTGRQTRPRATHMLEAAAVPKRPGLAPRARMAEGLDQGRGVLCRPWLHQEPGISDLSTAQPPAMRINAVVWSPLTAAKSDRRASSARC